MANYIVSCLSGWSNDVCQRMEAENVLHSLIYLLSNSEISKSLTNMVMQFILYLKCWLVIFLFHRSKMILFPTQILDILTRILDPSKEMKSKVWSYHSLVLRESSNSFYNLSEWLFSFWVIFSFIMDQLMGWQRNGVQQEMQGWLEMKMRKLHQQPGFMFVSMFCTPPLPLISVFHADLELFSSWIPASHDISLAEIFNEPTIIYLGDLILNYKNNHLLH